MIHPHISNIIVDNLGQRGTLTFVTGQAEWNRLCRASSVQHQAEEIMPAAELPYGVYMSLYRLYDTKHFNSPFKILQIPGFNEDGGRTTNVWLYLGDNNNAADGDYGDDRL